jgi:putative membrane protein
MVQFLLRWVVGAAAVFITVKIGETIGIGLSMKPGAEGIGAAFIFIAILTLVNAFVRPIVRFFTAPLNCLTLGLFSFVVNALMFWLASKADVGIIVKSFWAALFGSVVLSVISGVLNAFIVDRAKEERE